MVNKDRNKFMNVDLLESLLVKLVDNINSDLEAGKIELRKQQKIKGRMSLIGGNGRLRIVPSPIGCDVSLSGKSVEKQLYPKLKELFDRDCDGFKQTNKNTGIITQPYWRTENFSLVKKAAEIYSKTV
jgi:hypothetical protein